MKENILLAMMGIIITLMMVNGVQNDGSTFKGNSFAQCKTLTETTVSIGNQASTEVFSATSGRSWARIQRIEDSTGMATNTPSVSFSSTATLANGLQLSTTTPYIDFGMDTDHAYQGAVSLITDNGSTTVRVSECR